MRTSIRSSFGTPLRIRGDGLGPCPILSSPPPRRNRPARPRPAPSCPAVSHVFRIFCCPQSCRLASTIQHERRRMLIPPRALSRRYLLGATAALGAAVLLRPARAEPPKFKTVEDGYITIAMSGTMPVTGWIGDKLAGSDALMVQAIAEKLGLKAKPAIMAWSATIQAIRSGRADIMCGDMGWTKARADAMLLTDAIYYGGNFVTMAKTKPFEGQFDPNGFKDATVGTGTGYSYVPDIKKVPGIREVKLYDNVDACVRDIVAGRIDFAVLDSMTVDYMLLQ